jgi:hypothetical protein
LEKRADAFASRPLGVHASVRDTGEAGVNATA